MTKNHSKIHLFLKPLVNKKKKKHTHTHTHREPRSQPRRTGSQPTSVALFDTRLFTLAMQPTLNLDRNPLQRRFLTQIESELSNICDEILKLLDTRLIPSAATSDSKVFYLKHQHKERETREVREREGDEILRDAEKEILTQRREKKNKRIKIYYFGLA